MKKSIAFAAVAVAVVVAGARYSRRSASLALSSVEKQSLHDVPNDTPDDWGFNAVQGQAQGLTQGAKAVAQKPVSGQSSDLQKLLQEAGVSLSPGENAYDALRDLFEKGQAPSQADVSGSFSGQIFQRDDNPDKASEYGLVGQDVAGTVSSKFELVFKQKLERGDLGDPNFTGPDYDDTYAKSAPVQFGDHEVKFEWRSDIYEEQLVKLDLRVRKVGPYLVALVQAERLLHSEKPLWIGYFKR